jgi:hypothetical protein
MTDVRQCIVFAAKDDSSTALALSVDSLPSGLDVVGLRRDDPIGAMHPQKLDTGIVRKELLER